jgi:hypothetical protein
MGGHGPFHPALVGDRDRQHPLAADPIGAEEHLAGEPGQAAAGRGDIDHLQRVGVLAGHIPVVAAPLLGAEVGPMAARLTGQGLDHRVGGGVDHLDHPGAEQVQDRGQHIAAVGADRSLDRDPQRGDQAHLVEGAGELGRAGVPSASKMLVECLLCRIGLLFELAHVAL